MEGCAGGVLAEAHHIGAPGIAQHVVDLGRGVREQLGSVGLITLHDARRLFVLTGSEWLISGELPGLPAECTSPHAYLKLLLR